MKKIKMLLVGALATIAISCGTLGAVALLPVHTNYASAQASGMIVDALGNLSWTKVDGAASYNWTYQYGSTTSVEANTQTPSVNVNGVFKQAVEAGSNTITLTVTPVLSNNTEGTPITYEHTITGYTSYTGETHDISEFMAVEKTAAHFRATNIFDIQYSKNTMFTWGMNFDVPYAQNKRIAVKLGGVPRTTEAGALNYKGTIDNTARYCMSILDNLWIVKTKSTDHKKQYETGSVLLNLSTNYYFELAVMDNYSASGNAIGEKVYLAMYTADESGAKTLVNAETWEINTASITEGDVAQWTPDNKISLDICPYKEGGVYYTDNAGNWSASSVTGYDRVMVCTKTLLFSGDPLYKPDAEANGLIFALKDYYEIGKLNKMPATIEAEVMVDEETSNTSSSGVIVGNTVGNYGLDVTLETGRRVYVKIAREDGTKVLVRFSEGLVPGGYWVHLAVTLSDTECKLYVNGLLKETKTAGVLVDNNKLPADLGGFADDILDSPFFLGGNYQQKKGYFRGSVRSLAMYGDVRDAGEIAHDRLYGADTDDTDLLGAYKTPNTSVGTDIEDLSQNNQDIDYYHWDDLFFTEKTEPTDYAYSFAVVGDIQADATNAKKTIYKWIADNVQGKNIQYVFNMGDTTERNSNAEWEIAKEAISQLDGKVAYSILRGNHDSSANLNATFYYDAYTNQFNGFYEEGKIENSWRTFTVADTNYLMVTLDYAPTDEMLVWASEIIEAFPNHKVIITTHSYLSPRGTHSDENLAGKLDYNFEGDKAPADYDLDNNGVEIWEKLVKKHGNIFLVLSGHVTAQRAVMTQLEGVHGNTVTQMLVNPQYYDGSIEDTGMVVMLYFKNDGTIEVEEYSTVKQAYFREENQYSISGVNGQYTAHAFGEWVVEENQQTRTCTANDCGYSETQPVPPTVNVGDLYDGSKVKVYTLTTDGTIDVNFYIQLSDTHKANIENLQLKLVCGSETRNVPFPAACVGGGWVNGLYKFTYPVAAKEIDSEISLQLMIDEGVVGNTVSCSVRDYINSVQAADVSETYTQKLKDFVTALEDYCEAAAKFHGVENATIADSSRIDAVENTVFNDYGATVVGENKPRIAITLLTESTTTLRIYVGTSELPTIKANGVALEVKEAENGYYYADLAGIDAFSLVNEQTFVINDTITVTCSALTYGKLMDTTNADLVNVMKALYLYSQAATAYKA